MRLQGWAWLLCALVTVATNKDNEEGELEKDLISTLRRSSRAVCSSTLTITPAEDDLYWHVGGVQEVLCSVEVRDNSTPTSHNLTLRKNADPLPFQTVNDSAIRVTLNLTEPEEYKLICTGLKGEFCMTEVKVGYEPLPVEGLQCISHNWDVFSCSWTMPYNPAQEPADDYLPYLMSSEDPSKMSMCSCNDYDDLLEDTCTCPDTCCLWAGESYFNVSPWVVVVFAAMNDLGAANFTYRIDNYAVVLPNAMSAVNVESLAGQREAVVTWDLPPPMGTFAEVIAGVVVRVDHRLADAEETPWILGELLPCHDPICAKNGTHIISLEYWWRRFEVRVRLRSAAAQQVTMEEDGWWSDWQPRNVTTPPAAPDTPPAVGPGTFQVTDRGFPGLRDLTFTWQQVPALLHNGPDFGYLVQVCGAGPRDEEVLAEVTVSESFVVFRNLSNTSSYTLRVAARNSEGASRWEKVVVDPARPEPPLLPVVVVHARPGQDALYELLWQSSGDTAHYTVYLCTGEQNSCTGQLSWTSVVNASAANLTLQDFGLKGAAPSQVTFALSQEDAAGASSGMSWVRCSAPQPYTTTRDPPKLEKPLPGTSLVELPWSLDCRSRGGVVEGTEATYCRGKHRYPGNCTEKKSEVKGEAWTELFVLRGLESGVQYTAWLRMKYRSGSSQWSDAVTFITSTAGVEAWLIVVVVMVGTLATVVIVIGLVYSKRKFVDNLKKFRLQPSLPSGLVPEGRQESRRGSGGGGEGVRGGIPVSENTVSASVSNPAYSRILPTLFGSRTPLSFAEERNREENFGRGVTQGGRLVPSQQQQHHQRRIETNDNVLNTAAERATTDEGPEVSCGTSSSTSEPLLQGSQAPNYVTPYFSEGETETSDFSASEPLFPKSQVASDESQESLPSGGGGGGGGGYVPPSECLKFGVTQATPGYVTVQHGDDIGAATPGYVQVDDIPHATDAPDDAHVSKSPAEGRRYVSLDFPMMGGGPSLSQDLPDPTHDPITLSQDYPAPSHDPGDPSPISASLRGDVKDAELQDRVKKPNYISFPDAQLNMKWLGGDHAAPRDDKLDSKETENPSKMTCPPSDTPAPGYIAVQPPDFGNPAGEGTQWMTDDSEGKLCPPNSDFISALLSKPDNALHNLPCTAMPTAFPAITPGALHVPSEAHKPGNLHLPSTNETGGYVPFPALATEDKNDSGTSGNSWFSALMPSSSTFTSSTFSPSPTTGISFVMLSNLSSRGDKSDEAEIKESDFSARRVETDEWAENEADEYESAENENLVLDDLPLGYSRVGEQPE